MKNPNPECPREDCRFSPSPAMTTCVHYPAIYDKDGVNINSDKNKTSFSVECLTCGKIWKGTTCMGETTYYLFWND